MVILKDAIVPKIKEIVMSILENVSAKRDIQDLAVKRLRPIVVN